MLLQILALFTLALAPSSRGDWVESYLQGERALEAGDLELARVSFEAAVSELPGHTPSGWGLACVAARSGDADAAFSWLDAVSDTGGGENALLEWDEDLESLRADPRFAQLSASWTPKKSGRVVPAWDPRWPEAGSWKAKQGPGGTVRCRWIVDRERSFLLGLTADGFLLQVDSFTGKRISTTELFAGPFHSVAYDAIHSRLACVDSAGVLRLVQIASDAAPQVQLAPELTEVVGRRGNRLTFSPDGLKLFDSVAEGNFRILSALDGMVLASHKVEGQITAARWSAGGEAIALRLGWDRVHVLDLTAPLKSWTLTAERPIHEMAIAPGSGDLWLSCEPSLLVVLNFETGALRRRIEYSDVDSLSAQSGIDPGDFSIDPTGVRAAVSTDSWGWVICWRVADGERLWAREYPGGTGAPIYHRFTQDGLGLYVYGQLPNRGGLLDVQDGTITTSYEPLRLAGSLLPVADDAFCVSRSPGRLQRFDVRSGKRQWTHVATLAGGWLLYDEHGHVDGDARSFHRFQTEADHFHWAKSDAGGLLLDAKRVRASVAGVVLAPAPQGRVPRAVWRRPEEQVLRVPEDRNTCWIEVFSDSETEILGFEVREGDLTQVIPGKPDAGGMHLRYLVERSEDGSPRNLRVQALGPRGSRSAPVHFRVEFETR